MKKLFSYILLIVVMFCFVACNRDDDETPRDKAPEGVEAVDLGLSVKWANMNIGATTPEAYGNYFACGETSPKESYDKSTYHCNVENKAILELADDAAHANWGGSWRMPTMEEQDELRTKCTWEWITLNGINGSKVTGPNGNSIFLPAAGFRIEGSVNWAGTEGNYRSSSLNTFPDCACVLSFYQDNVDLGHCLIESTFAMSVRAVCP